MLEVANDKVTTSAPSLQSSLALHHTLESLKTACAREHHWSQCVQSRHVGVISSDILPTHEQLR